MAAELETLEARLLDIPGDMCDTKARYIENAKAFLGTLTSDAAILRKGVRRLMDAEIIADIRDEGAGVWDFWKEEGMLDGIRNRDFAALRA